MFTFNDIGELVHLTELEGNFDQGENVILWQEQIREYKILVSNDETIPVAKIQTKDD